MVVTIHTSDFTWDSESEGYYRRHRLSNGQFCQIAFYREEYSRATEYYVAFAVADKKKHLNGCSINQKTIGFPVSVLVDVE